MGLPRGLIHPMGKIKTPSRVLTVLTVLATFLSSFTPATALTSQSITFTQPAAMTFPTSANQTLTASASSNLKVTFTSTTPSVCLVGTGNKSTVQPLAVGTCTIRAAQAGSKTFSAAASVDKSFDITAGTSERSGLSKVA